MHVLEIPKFHQALGELQEPLDFWLYFLKNGEELDADTLPVPLDTPEIRRAMEILKMLAQNDLERELYEGRLKAKRDLQTLETLRRMLETRNRELEARSSELEARSSELEAKSSTLEAKSNELEAQRDQWHQRYTEAARQRDEASRQRDEAQSVVRDALMKRIQLCQRLLGRDMSGAEELATRDVSELRLMAESLERELSSSS